RLLSFLFRARDARVLDSFPTRRSSDLGAGPDGAAARCPVSVNAGPSLKPVYPTTSMATDPVPVRAVTVARGGPFRGQRGHGENPGQRGDIGAGCRRRGFGCDPRAEAL